MANEPKEKEKESETTPSALEDKNIKTKVTSFKQKVKDTLMAVEDLATLEILLPVNARMRDRLKSIKKLSQAQHIKVQGHFKTTKPKMHIKNLVGKKLSNDEARITFSVYKMDDKGNKLRVENKATEVKDGREIETIQSIDYPIDCEVTEIIRLNKKIDREIMKIGE